MTVQHRRGRTLIVRTGQSGRWQSGLIGRGPALGLAAVLLISALAVFPLAPRMINPYDEGMVAYGAERVLHGHQPAVDFYSPYGPGVFYLIATAYRLLGTRLLVERWVAAALLVAIGGLCYSLLVNRPGLVVEQGGRRLLVSGVAAVTVVLMLASGWWYTPVNSGALALMLLSGLALQRGLLSGSPGWAAAAGALAGLTLVWRLAFGGALLVANGIVWAATAGGATSESRQQQRMAGLIAMGAAAAAVAFPVYAGLICAGGQRAFLSLLVWPLTSTGAADLPWPAIFAAPPRDDPSLLSRLAAATYGASFYYGLITLLLLLWRLPLRSVPTVDRHLGLWLLLMLPPMFLYAHGRTDYLHITPLLSFSLLLAALAVDSGLAVQKAPGDPSASRVPGQATEERVRREHGWDSQGDGASLAPGSWRLRVPTKWVDVPWRLASVRAWQGLGLAVWVGSLALLVPTVLFSARQIWDSPGRTPLSLPGTRGAGVYAPFRFSRQYRMMVPLIQANVAPAQSIYSGTTRHDIYLTNDILIYFLAERNAATYYWCLDAGLTSSAPVQQEMLREMAGGGVAAAVLWTAAMVGEKNKGGRSSRVLLLDNWLSEEFISHHVRAVHYDFRLRRGLWQ